MKIGMAELVVVFIVALVVIGPDKLPFYAKKLGEALAQFRKYSAEATRDIKESIVEPLEEAQRPLREAVEPLNDLDKALRSDAKEVKDSFAGLGKQSSRKAPGPSGDDAGKDKDILAEEAQTNDINTEREEQ